MDDMREIWMLINQMSPYLLLGFGFAGLLHAFVPAVLYRRYLGGNDFRSVLWDALDDCHLDTDVCVRYGFHSHCRCLDAQGNHSWCGPRATHGWSGM